MSELAGHTGEVDLTIDPITDIMTTPPKPKSRFMEHYGMRDTKFWALVKDGTIVVFRSGLQTMVTPQSERRYARSLLQAQAR